MGKWWVVDDYGELHVTNVDPRWGIAAGPFDTEGEADAWLESNS